MDRVHRIRFLLADHPFDRWLLDQGGVAARDLTDRTARAEFRRLQHGFVRRVIAPLLPYRPLVQRGAYVRLHLPNEASGTAFHSDAGLGHGTDEENVWIALSPATLFLLSLEDSEALAIDDRFEERARALAVPISIEPGEALLFTARHIHGVPPNRGSSAQVTLDFRITPRVNPHAILGCPFEALAEG